MASREHRCAKVLGQERGTGSSPVWQHVATEGDMVKMQAGATSSRAVTWEAAKSDFFVKKDHRDP